MRIASKLQLKLLQDRVHSLSAESLHELLQKDFPNVNLRLTSDTCSVSILGPAMGYLALDPDLAEVCGRMGTGSSEHDILSNHQSEGHIDWYYEDSWTAYSVVSRLRESSFDSLVLIHLDDHEDLMPVLARPEEGTFVDLAQGRTMCPQRPQDVRAGIRSGVIGIANHLTVLCYAFKNIHVRHLHATFAPEETTKLFRVTQRTSSCQNASQIGVLRADNGEFEAGTYQRNDNIVTLLQDIPPGPIIVHVDLDYFINDYNGDQTFLTSQSDVDKMACAAIRMEAFFQGVSTLRRPVEAWLIGMSPGFCASRHWAALLRLLRANIDRVQSVNDT